MKLLVVTSLKECQKDIADIMDKSGITAYSVTSTIGFKDCRQPNLLDSWFSSSGGQFDSIFLFSFTDAARAEQALLLVKRYNEEKSTDFLIRAFVMPVEMSS